MPELHSPGNSLKLIINLQKNRPCNKSGLPVVVLIKKKAKCYETDITRLLSCSSLAIFSNACFIFSSWFCVTGFDPAT